MKLDRNTNQDGRGKYALIKLRDCEPDHFGGIVEVAETAVDYGDSPDTEFFVIRLRDQNAELALRAYAASAFINGDKEFALEVKALADKAAAHPNKRQPD